MNETDVVQICSSALLLAAKLAGPLLAVALVVGLVISLLQAVFQAQDQTLSMVPKFVLGGLVLAMTGGWMLRTAVEFTIELFNRIPELVA